MPPKRKNKAGARATVTSPPPDSKVAGAIRTSSTKRTSTSVQGLRTSRLQPTEPLHMTTRGAAKAASTHTSPAAPSSTDGSSRRSSLNDIAHFNDHSDVEDARPAKRSRVSTVSGSPPNSMGSFISQIPAVEMQSPEQQIHPSQPASTASKAPGKKRRASADSSGSSKTVSARANGVATRSESDVSEKQPRRKKRKTSDVPPEPADAPPELTDASTPPGSPEQIPEVSSSQGLQNVFPAANGEAPTKATKRLPGRRRQPHSDLNVEVDLRRQLNIKMGYRSVAKVQKQILEELSRRAIKNVEDDPSFHKQGPEYDYVMAQLQERRQGRVAQVEAERKYKLDQLERVRVAEERIQQEQFVNRFEELRENLLLQCYYQLKQMQRQSRIDHGDGTDDEEHIIQPTRVEFPVCNADDRLGSKYASRSRAYVETERMLEEEDLRSDLDQLRKTFLETNEDLDDSIEAIPTGFARFIGPDRAEAIAHFNIASLADAATEIERTPPPPEPPKAEPIEQTDALFLLASLSAERAPMAIVKSEEQQQAAISTIQTSSPKPKLLDESKPQPCYPLTPPPAAVSSATPIHDTTKQFNSPKPPVQAPPQVETNGVSTKKPIEAAPKPPPARFSTHRIMDILNNDDVPIPSSRDSRGPQPPVHQQNPSASPSIPASTVPISQNYQSSHSETPQTGPSHSDAPVHAPSSKSEYVSDQPAGPHTEEPLSQPLGSPSQSDQFWTSRNIGAASDLPRDTRDPLMRIKSMLHAKEDRKRVQGPGEGSTHERPETPTPTLRSDSDGLHNKSLTQSKDAEDRDRNRYQGPDNAISDRSTGSTSRRGSTHAQTSPLLTRAFSPHGRPDNEKETRRTSIGGYHPSPSTGPVPPYEQSPRDHHSSYSQASRPGSYDQQPRPSWDRDRRMSGSQGPPPSYTSGSPYAASPPQPYQPRDYKKPAPTPPTHHSPYPPPSSHLPPPTASSHSLPPKPPAPPGPINFRFAHYDPAPQVRSPYAPHAQHAPYSPVSHSHHQAPPAHYPVPYSTAPPFPGYVPPAGSFQAPPPPPPLPPQTNTQYPPLKIHQYGGQPILPANMAPPQSHSQQSPQSYGPPSHTHQSGYQPAPPASPYEHNSSGPPPAPERPDPQPRPRRAYRSYHAPGTEFRTYNGPNQRRRGGGSTGGSN